VIASVAGTVSGLLPDGVVVEVGGVGLAVQTTPGTRARLRVGESARLATSLVVREDSLTLYGFADDDERTLFELLQTSSGVGPRLAQAVLTVHTPDTVRRALSTEDLAVLVQVPGIGRKGAQRMVLELKDKVGPLAAPAAGGAPTVLPSWRDTVGSALVGLGFTPAQSDDAVERLAADRASDGDEAGGPADADVPTLLRAALALLARP
jgi:Holliday junction DNA helicase RuvA